MQLRKWKSSLILIILGSFLIFGLLPASADQLADFKEQQRQLQEKMQEQKRTLQEKEQQKKTFIGQLQELEDNIVVVQNDLGSLDSQMKNAQARLEQTEKELDKKEEALNQRTAAFKDRLREVYINGQVSYLEVVFQATDVSDFLVRFDLLEKLVQQDVDLLDEIETERQAVAAKKQELEKRRDQISQIQSDTKQKKAVLATRYDQKEQLLKAADEEKVAAEKALNEMEALSNQIAAKIRKIQEERSRNSNSHFSGRFTWPTPGYTRVTSEFGWRIHPILKERRMHTGIDIAAPSGTSIHAADDGTVIYAGWLGAYGQVVVIDHGDGISSMYCHQSRILVSENEKLKKGEILGRVGSTGWSTGAHLHFEVRKNGDPVNPWNYLK